MSQLSSMFPDCFYRVTIKGLCVRDGKVLLMRETRKGRDRWELPGGGLDFGEALESALAREVREEMGLLVTRMSKRPVYVWTHKFEKREERDWFYSCVLAYRIEFQDLAITPTEECQEVRFFSKEELQTLDFKGGQTEELKELFNPEDFTENF